MKKIGISLIAIICLLTMQTKVVYAWDDTNAPADLGGSIQLNQEQNKTIGTEQELEDYFVSIATGGEDGYYVSTVESLQVTVKLRVKVTEVEKGWFSTHYTILIGTGAESDLITWTAGIETLIAEDKIDDIEEGDEWDVWMDIEYVEYARRDADGNFVSDPYGDLGTVQVFWATVYRVYNDDDFNPEEDGWDGTPAHKLAKYIESKISTEVGDFVTKFIHNPIGTLATYLFDFIRNVLGDAPQIAINSIQTLVMETFSDWTLVYDVDDIPDAANDYLNYDDYVENGTTWTEWSIDVDGRNLASYEGDDDEFSTNNTRLPVICVDYYNMAVGDINFFDINFLTGDDTHEDDSVWTILRNVATALIHATLYVTAAVLLATLIWRGILIVLHSGDSPKAQAIQREGLNKFVISLAMLIGTIIIMALCIFASQAVFNTSALESAESSKELPIRVNVKTAGYSFSTNITGYVRYMTEIENVDKYMEKISYVIVYILLVWINVVATIFMILRMFAIWVLSILGPIIAASYAFDKKIIMPYKTWVSLYVTLALSQLIFAIIYSILLNVIFID